eukprot:CAMPEP_0194206968 /NCGR_PEP_ID=MMETSP0156-20130528/5861_1 /TAXON_ID=33649 /ORGANISM="Thalassionema nitzschioides, Strain L26-B" /LENGTH=127 /DNA_ID=CAMNT_0038933633 /DNA_START=91 /DNA_END=474 /DNA_ORIENTATION=-
MTNFLFDDARSIDSDAITVKAGTSPKRKSLLRPLPITKKPSSRTVVSSSCASSTTSRSCTSSPPRIRPCLFWKRREHMSRAARRLYEEEHQLPTRELSSRRRKQGRVTLPMKRFLTTCDAPNTMAEF